MRRRLLLADDSATIQRVIELTFAGQDVEVLTVRDGDQAIARIPEERPDIVLADIGMPGPSGYEVCAFVKERPDLRQIPVLLLAGAFEPVDDRRAREVRCDGVLVKPFEPQQVIARVRELVGQRPAGEMAPASPPAVAPPPQVQPPASTSAEEPQLARPEIGVASAAPGDRSLDNYFDRLDAAFATMESPASSPPPPPSLTPTELASVPSAPMPQPADEEPFVVPTIDELLGGALRGSMPEPAPQPLVMPPPPEPPDAPSTLAGAPAVAPVDLLPPASPSPHSLADTFTALLAVERGEADPSTVRPPLASSPGIVTEELLDELTRRVLERLAPDTARDLVADIVADVAERLVREEIERIRGR